MNGMNSCYICGSKSREDTDTCDYCQSIINKKKNKYGSSNLREAMKNACPKRDEKGEILFRCHYTGIYGKFNPEKINGYNPIEDAFSLSIDHKDPKVPDSIVVSLHIINAMKQNIPEDKFIEMVKILSRYFNKNIDQKSFEKELRNIIDSSIK